MEGEVFQRLTEHQFPLELEVLLLSLAKVKQWEVRNLLPGPTDKKGNFINISKDDSSYVETLQLSAFTFKGETVGGEEPVAGAYR